MKQISFRFFSAILFLLLSCSPKKATTAIISVTFGDPPVVKTNDVVFYGTEKAVIKSDVFLQHTVEALDLPKSWNVSQNEAVQKLDRAISVHLGNEPSQIEITATGLNHQTTVKVLNELCNFYVTNEMWISEDGGSQQKVNVKIIQQAK